MINENQIQFLIKDWERGVLKNAEDIDKLILALKQKRVEIIDRDKNALIIKIKKFVLEYINNIENYTKYNFSYYLKENVSKNYSYLCRIFLFSEKESIYTYLKKQKIELVKNLIEDNQLTITEISNKLGYNSLSHLSDQFKKNENISPREWKENYVKK